MEHLDYLWTYLWYIVRHVTFVIYMWRLWYICGAGDIYVLLMIYMWCWWCLLYIYLLFVWMGCKKQIKKAVFSHFAECNGHDTRQSDNPRTCLGTCFAECTGHCTRQTSQIYRVPRARNSAKGAYLPSVLAGHSANRRPLPSAWIVALGKAMMFAECNGLCTRQSMFPGSHFVECHGHCTR